MASEHLLLEHFLGIGDPQRWRKICNYLLERQLPDGSWPIYYGGPGDVSITIEAYFALKLAGADPAIAAHDARARVHPRPRRPRRAAHLHALWLASSASSPGTRCPAMPVELILLPPRFPINIYALSSWARGDDRAAPRRLGASARRRAAAGRGVDELCLDPPTAADIRVPAATGRPLTWRNFFLALDRVLRAARAVAVEAAPRRARSRRASAGSSRTRTRTAAGAASSRRG